ncbi:MAG: 2-hydroxyacid dehydrogenase [Candidatus Bipolaricaulaceae bacterium]
MAKVLITTDIFPAAADRLRAAGHAVEVLADGPLPSSRLRGRLADADALICLLSDRVDAELLAAAPRLRVVANLAVGVDNIDLAAATRHGVRVANTPGVLTETTADLAWALLMAAARRIVEADRDLRAHGFPGWTLIPPHLGVDIYGNTLGVVGLGRIGSAVARRARGFSMRIVYHSRTRKPQAERELAATYASLPELLPASDFVVLCLPLTPATRHLIGAAELSLMKPDAVLVNVGRGPVVDEEALAAALRGGTIRAAALDVFEREPGVHPDLLKLDNVVLTPHIGSATVATRQRMAELAVEAVLAVLSGREPQHLANPEVCSP